MNDNSNVCFGRQPKAPRVRSWSKESGFSWVEWLGPNGWVLNEVPMIGETYTIRILGNFIGTIGQEFLFPWLPADSAINGFDAGNKSDVAEYRFVTGKLISADLQNETIQFVPSAIIPALDLLQASPLDVVETDTLMDGMRQEYRYQRFRCVDYNFEGDVSARYLFIDSQLIMLEDCVFRDGFFWIGNGSFPRSTLNKILDGNDRSSAES